MLHRNIGSYDAVIKDSVTKGAGKKILASWKITLQSILGSSFILSKDDFGPGSYIKDSWFFKNGKVSVFLGLEQYFFNEKLFGVTFSILHEHEHLR